MREKKTSWTNLSICGIGMLEIIIDAAFAVWATILLWTVYQAADAPAWERVIGCVAIAAIYGVIVFNVVTWRRNYGAAWKSVTKGWRLLNFIKACPPPKGDGI